MLTQRLELGISQLHLHTSHVRMLPQERLATMASHGRLTRALCTVMMCAMLLAEALAARKDTVKEIEVLSARLKGAVVRYEDQDASVDDPANVVLALGRALDRLEDLTVRINRTNNATRVDFGGRDLNLMEAIAMRERMVLEAKARRGGVEAVEQATGKGKGGRGWLGTKRAKDDVRELPTVDLQGERSVADKLSETVRLLDLAVQQRNWTTQLSE